MVAIPVVSLELVMLGAVMVAASYWGIPMPDAILLGVLAICGLILRYTAFGRRLFAIGGNRLAAHLAGIDIRWPASLVFAGMGLLYGLSGCVAKFGTGTRQLPEW